MIRGGQEGYERLLLLARDRWPDTAALFERAALSAGMRCVDLGCGGGAVTLEMARLVGPEGSVTGVDMDEIKLDLGRRAAERRGLANVEFRALNVQDWEDPGGCDAVYCRFLLQHLSQPGDLLRRMWAAVRPGGVLIVEDADFDGWCCHPGNAGFDFFVRLYGQVVQRCGGDHTIGRKLYDCFLAAGIPGAAVALVQSLWLAGEGKTLAWSTLEASTEAILSERLATKDEVTAALTSLERFTADPQTLICGPRVFQLWSRRPLRHRGRGNGEVRTLVGIFIGWRAGKRLAQGDDMHVDTKRARLPDDPRDVRAAAGELLPTAAAAGPDHDLGDLILPREAGDGPGGIIARYLVPASADVGRQLAQLLDALTVTGPGGVAGDDVDGVEFPLEPGRPSGPPGAARHPSLAPG